MANEIVCKHCGDKASDSEPDLVYTANPPMKRFVCPSGHIQYVTLQELMHLGVK